MPSNEWLFATEKYIRVGCFLMFFFLLAWLETRYTWRARQSAVFQRWGKHFSLTLLSKAAIRLVFPILLLQTAMIAQKGNQGVLNQIQIPYFLKFFLGFMALDSMIYLHHRLMHRFKWFWYCHRVHHIDKELDVSTGIRFHPIEELLSMALKAFGVVFWGAPVLAVLIFEVLLNFGSLFTHTNIKLSNPMEKYVRWFIVTPGMHRIHHSDNPLEFNSNFGFFLSIWDRIFGTYRPKALTGENRLVLGQTDYREDKYQTLGSLLLHPFNLKKMRPRKKIPRKIVMRSHDE